MKLMLGEPIVQSRSKRKVIDVYVIKKGDSRALEKFERFINVRGFRICSMTSYRTWEDIKENNTYYDIFLLFDSKRPNDIFIYDYNFGNPLHLFYMSFYINVVNRLEKYIEEHKSEYETRLNARGTYVINHSPLKYINIEVILNEEAISRNFFG